MVPHMAKDKNNTQTKYIARRSSGWSSLLRDLFQSELIAPTDVDPKDIQFSRRVTVYRFMLLLMLAACGSIAVEFLVAKDALPGLAWAAFAVECVLAATLLRLLQKQRVLIPPVISLALTVGLVLVVVADGATHHTLWLFPLMIALTGLLPTIVALVLGLMTLGLLIGARGYVGDASSLAEDTTLAATWLISLAVMQLMTRQSDELADLALSDPLTGAYNRRYLAPQTQRNLADYQRYARLSTLMLFDLDHFKDINDRYGHPEGDRILKAVVNEVDQRIRGVDMLFRLGGEEFVVLLAEVGVSTATRVAEDIRTKIEKLELLPDRAVTVSIGLCDVTCAETPEEWLEKTDQAMYEAKQSGRNRVFVIEPSSQDHGHITSSLPGWR